MKDNGDDLARVMVDDPDAKLKPEDEAKILPVSDAELTDARVKALLAGKRDGLAIPCFPLASKLLCGLSDLVTLTGPPGVGKSAWAHNAALSVSEKGTPVLYYSLEMPAEEMTRRTLLSAATKYGKWELLREDGDALKEATAEVLRRSANLYTIGRTLDDGTPRTVTPELIEAHAGAIKERYDGTAPLIVIDHGRYVTVPGYDQGASEYERDQELYRHVQAIPQTTGAVVLLILEQNKAGAGTGGMMSSKGTVSSVYDASTVLILWDPQYKDAEEDPETVPEYTGQEDAAANAERSVFLIVRKNRNGPSPRKVRYAFHGPEYRFEETREREPIA